MKDELLKKGGALVSTAATVSSIVLPSSTVKAEELQDLLNKLQTNDRNEIKKTWIFLFWYIFGFEFLETWIVKKIKVKEKIRKEEDERKKMEEEERIRKEDARKKREEEEKIRKEDERKKREEEEKKKEKLCTEIKKLVDEENEKLEEQYKGLPKVFGKVFLKFDEKNFSVSTVLSDGWQIQRKCGNFSINCEKIAGTNANKEDILDEVKKYIEKFKEANTEQIEATKKLMKKVEELNKASNECGMGFKLECAGHPDNSILCFVTPCDDGSIGREMYALSLNYSPGAKDLTVKQQVEENLKLVDRMQESIASMKKANESLEKNLPAYHEKGFSFFVSRNGRLFFATGKVKSNEKEQNGVFDNRKLILDVTLSDKKFEGDMGGKYTKIDTKELSDKLDEIENNGLFLGYINKKHILPENVIERCKRFSEVKSIVGEYNEKLKELGDKERFFVSIGTKADMLRNYGKLDKVLCFTKEEKEEQESCFPVVYMVVNSGNNNEYQVNESFTVFNKDGKVDYNKLRNRLDVILKRRLHEFKKTLSDRLKNIDNKTLNRSKEKILKRWEKTTLLNGSKRIDKKVIDIADEMVKSLSGRKDRSKKIDKKTLNRVKEVVLEHLDNNTLDRLKKKILNGPKGTVINEEKVAGQNLSNS